MYIPDESFPRKKSWHYTKKGVKVTDGKDSDEELYEWNEWQDEKMGDLREEVREVGRELDFFKGRELVHAVDRARVFLTEGPDSNFTSEQLLKMKLALQKAVPENVVISFASEYDRLDSSAVKIFMFDSWGLGIEAFHKKPIKNPYVVGVWDKEEHDWFVFPPKHRIDFFMNPDANGVYVLRTNESFKAALYRAIGSYYRFMDFHTLEYYVMFHDERKEERFKDIESLVKKLELAEGVNPHRLNIEGHYGKKKKKKHYVGEAMVKEDKETLEIADFSNEPEPITSNLEIKLPSEKLLAFTDFDM